MMGGMTQGPETRDRPEARSRLRTWLAVVAGAAGGAVAIGAMEGFSAFSQFPLASIPFATSIVLVLGSPDAPPAQPRALIGGHIISAVVGLLVLQVTGPSGFAAAMAVGLAIVAMHATRTFHPPAGINPLLIVVNALPWSFLLVPVAAGALLLAAFAWGWHKIGPDRDWPQHWW
jgi:CBS-domain-containing membrane protein